MMAAPVFPSLPDPFAPTGPRSVRPTPSPTTDILDLIDGALEDYTVSVDAARWVPDEARQTARFPIHWFPAAETSEAGDSPYGAGGWAGRHANGERLLWVGFVSHVVEDRSRSILAAATGWYGSEAAARRAAELEAERLRAEAALRLVRDVPIAPDPDRGDRRCPDHQGSDEPTDPVERALWLRRNRNTGPKRPSRAPKRIDARRSR